MTESTPAQNGSPSNGPALSRNELADEVSRSRAQLGETIDQLTTRLSPSYQASNLARSTRQAADDARSFVTGSGFPTAEPERARNAKILVGAVALGVALVAAAVVKGFSRR